MTLLRSQCPACGHRSPRAWTPGTVPLPLACNVLCRDAAAARAAERGVLTLLFCERCSLTWNGSFEEERLAYQPGYENSLHHSPAFGRYADELARELVESFGLRTGTAVEVGCGRGDFLRALVAAGCLRGLGFDPSLPGPHVEDRLELHGRRATVQDFADARLVLARHVLEHVSDPVAFVRMLGARGTPLYLEVPRAEFMFGSGSFWDLVYEHVSYFSAPALRALAGRAGYAVDQLRPSFGRQFLSLLASPARAGAAADALAGDGEIARLGQAFDRFGAAFTATLEEWSARVARMADDGPVVVWGAGSKGATFLNFVESRDRIRAAVDLNPLKQGGFVPGTGHPIVAPADLHALRPATVLVMNPNYLDEIGAELARLGLGPALVPVLSEAERMALAG